MTSCALTNSTLSGIEGVLDSRPTVGKLTPARFQTMSFPDGENRKLSSKIESTTSDDAPVSNAPLVENEEYALISSWENLKPLESHSAGYARG